MLKRCFISPVVVSQLLNLERCKCFNKKITIASVGQKKLGGGTELQGFRNRGGSVKRLPVENDVPEMNQEREWFLTAAVVVDTRAYRPEWGMPDETGHSNVSHISD